MGQNHCFGLYQPPLGRFGPQLGVGSANHHLRDCMGVEMAVWGITAIVQPSVTVVGLEKLEKLEKRKFGSYMSGWSRTARKVVKSEFGCFFDVFWML